jgi:ABC-type branched-subunit amino acid transport system ATPase component
VTGSPIIEVKDLTRRFGALTAVDHLNLEVAPGEIFGLVGPDGAGKTYWGRVSFIASEAEFTPKQIQTQEERVKLVYRIKIDLPNPQSELKLNMPADALISQ